METNGVNAGDAYERGEEPVEPELAAALNSLPSPPADPDFVARLQTAFVYGELPAAASGIDPDPHIAELERELAPILTAWSPDPVRPAFLRELHGSFLSAGETRTTATRRTATPRRAGRTPVRRRRAVEPPDTGRRRLYLVVGGLAAAAAAVVVYFNLAGPRGATPEHAPVVVEKPSPAQLWKVDARSYVASALRLDGKALSSEELAEGGDADAALAERLGHARLVEVASDAGDTGLRMRFGDYFLLELGAGTRLDLSGLPETWKKGEDIVLAGDLGSFRVATSARFHEAGLHLWFQTPELKVECVGTVFGVDVYPEEGTCVCCTRGSVKVHTADEEHDLPAGEFSFVFKDLRTELEAIGPDHVHRPPLEALDGYWD